MSHTYSQNTVHIVFSTKDRRNSIPPDLRPRLWAYAAGICNKLGVHAHAIGGTANHIHLLLQIPPALPLAKAVVTIKSNSSRWSNADPKKRIDWQEGYGAFSVCQRALPSVARYIETQEEHHKKIDFDAEFLALLREHGIAFDPKFVLG